MDTAHDTDQRLMDLEIKASFLEDLVESLNQVVIRQQQQIDLLVREVKACATRCPSNRTGNFPQSARRIASALLSGILIGGQTAPPRSAAGRAKACRDRQLVAACRAKSGWPRQPGRLTPRQCGGFRC